MSVGTTLALIGLLLTLFALPSLFPDGGAGRPERRRRRRALPGLARRADRRRGDRARGRASRSSAPCSSSAAWVPSSSPGPPLLPPRSASWRRTRATPPRCARSSRSIVAAQAGVAVIWWRRAAGAVSWADMCVLAMMVLAALDAFAYLVASEPYGGAWWAIARAARRPVRRARRRAADRLHRRRREAARVRGRADREPGRRARARAARAQERVTLDQRAPRTDPLAHADADRRRGLDVAFQPIVDLASRARGRCRGAGALPRRRRRADPDRALLPRRARGRPGRAARAGRDPAARWTARAGCPRAATWR